MNAAASLDRQLLDITSRGRQDDARPPVVRLDGAARSYGAGAPARVALRQTTCEVPEGARICLTGPSGSGKSTLLHLMAGLEEPTVGTVEWPAIGPRKSLRPGPVAIVFQGPSLLPDLSVAENVALPLILAGADEPQAAARARTELERLELGELRDKLPEEISGGQAQRAAIARALAGEPRLILADEPTGQLDREIGAHVVDQLLTAADHADAALVLSTHDPSIAARLPVRWQLADGALSLDGDPARAQGRAMRLALGWLAGLVAHRRARLLATVAGVALGVALLASIGTFLSATTSKMTDRAVRSVPVDWQVEAQPGANPAQVVARTRRQPSVRVESTVSFAETTGFVAKTGGTVQRTGPGKVLGLSSSYPRDFPGSVRLLAGSADGPLLAQQTAANLQARPGDRVAVGRAGLHPATVRIAGVVDLPAADSLFQMVGAPPGAQLQAPPDNVLILPPATFQKVEGPLRSARPDLIRVQAHAGLDRSALPSSPGAAYSQVTGQAHNLEAKLAGAGLVGDNLSTALGKAREDALYAQLLFLFLGLPGAILAGLVTASIAAAGSDRRRRDQALLRTRGATTAQLVRHGARRDRTRGARRDRPRARSRARDRGDRLRQRELRRRHGRRGALGGGLRHRRPRHRRGRHRPPGAPRRPRGHRRRRAPHGRPD